jgi:inner membrane protein YhjD
MAGRSLTERLDAFQRDHPWASIPLAVTYKFVDDQGGYLAALITYYGFVSLFPLLLLLSSVLGVILRSNPHLQQQIIESVLSQFPVIGNQLGDPRQLGGGVTAIVIGSLTALYGGLGVAQATQHAMNQIWDVPRNRRPNPIKARLRSLLLPLTGGLALLGATVLSAMGSGSRSYSPSAGQFVISGLLIVASVLVNAGVFLLAFRVSTDHERLTLRAAAPGAVTAALFWQLLQLFGAQYVTHVVQVASISNSLSAVVLGLLAFIYLSAVALVVSMQVNVVLAKKLYPRALLAPFTDDVDLTRGDRTAYTDAAKAEQQKGFETVEVTFENDGLNASRAHATKTTGSDEPVANNDDEPAGANVGEE